MRSVLSVLVMGIVVLASCSTWMSTTVAGGATAEVANASGRGGAGSGAESRAGEPLLTVAESSDWRKTARYDEVQAFAEELASRSPLVRLSTLGSSYEGREIPVLILADPPIQTPEEASRSGKPMVLLLGGIHAGECDGKEALLMLARELVLSGDAGAGEPRAHRVLKDVIVAIAPIYNPDGNERMSPDNRRGQVGPDEMGIRENAQGLDLNRDFVKLEAPETRGLLRFINRWDPAVIVDTHTTNGSFHRYPLTFDGPKNPAGDSRVIEYVRDTMLPSLTTRVKDNAGIDTFWYGNFAGEFGRGEPADDRHSRWETYPDLPRYGVPYFGLRNRIGILTESYSYATYKERIEAQLAFTREILNFTAEHREPIKKLISDADSRTIAQGRRAQGDVAISSTMAAAPKKATVLGYVEERRDGRNVSTGELKDYEVDLFTRFEPERTVKRPFAYILAGGAGGADRPVEISDLQTDIFSPRHAEWLEAAVHNLQRHGITVEELREDIELEVTTYTIGAVTKAMRPFQGHELVTVRAEGQTGSRLVHAGSYIVRMAQPLGSLASYLLEPESADGLTVWNFFDPALEIGSSFPVLRLESAVPLLLVDARPPPGSSEEREGLLPITFEDVYGGGRPPNLNGSPASAGAWIDSEHFLQVREGRLRKVHAVSGRSEPFHDPAKMAAGLAKLPTIDRRTADSISRRTSFAMNRDRSAALFEHRGDLYYASFDGTTAVRLTSDPRRAELATFSPDGRFVAFVRENDLWVVDVETQRERQLTTGGTDLIRHGKADWVYYEEIFRRNWRVYWWSPDSQSIAYMRVDSRPVRTFTVVNDIPDPPNNQRVEVTPYPKAGTPNPRATLHVVDAAGGEPREVNLEHYNEEDRLIVGVGWWPDSSALYAYVSNRTQTWLDVLSARPRGGEPTRLFRETTGAWVARSPALRFLADRSFIFSSERDGWMHLYHYAADGALIRRITEGEWEIRGIAGGDDQDEAQDEESDRWIYFTAMRDNPLGANLYRVRLDGSDLQRLTPTAGAHATNVSPDGRLFVASWSSHAHPTRVVLYSIQEEDPADDEGRGADSPRASLVRILDTNPVRALETHRRVPSELVQIPTSRGYTLDGTLLFPPDFDPGRVYPVWLTTYAGPKAPSISDTWTSSRIWDQVLAQRGYIVFRVDPCSSSSKGAISAWRAYKQLGAPELEDIKTAVEWLCAHEWADADRIGMSGHSYGGFMTAYAMTNSTLFAAGIAGAPVTDWRLYDSIYTERYMLTPQENPDGYDRTSVIASAKNLHGRLLLLHGMADDNVHLQNATRLMHAFQQAGVQNFELMLYPEARHGLGGGASGRHYQRLMIEFIDRALGPGGGRERSPGSPAPAYSESGGD